MASAYENLFLWYWRGSKNKPTYNVFISKCLLDLYFVLRTMMNSVNLYPYSFFFTNGDICNMVLNCGILYNHIAAAIAAVSTTFFSQFSTLQYNRNRNRNHKLKPWFCRDLFSTCIRMSFVNSVFAPFSDTLI